MTAAGTRANVLNALTGSPVPVERAVTSPSSGGIPDAPGLYAWWVRAGALDAVHAPKHPVEPELRLLYIGIGPVRSSSSQLLRSRVVGNHLRGNTGSSTFRLSLASLLVNDLDLRPVQRGKKVILTAGDNARLSEWQQQNLGVTWAVETDPWLVEAQVIESLQPALNLAGNAEHPFHSTIAGARADFRRLAAGGQT